MPLRTVAVQTKSMHEALYRFRYEIYVEEMSRTQIYADHGKRKIEDPLDASACNLVVLNDGEIVACVRSNLSRNGGLDDYERMLRMHEVPDSGHPANTSLCTRLMVRSDFRSSPALVRIFLENYRYGLKSGIRWTFLDCNDHLVSMFSRFGFVFLHKFEHPEYGQVNAMRLDLLDLAHLQAIHSPFAAVLENAMETNTAPTCADAPRAAVGDSAA